MKRNKHKKKHNKKKKLHDFDSPNDTETTTSTQQQINDVHVSRTMDQSEDSRRNEMADNKTNISFKRDLEDDSDVEEKPKRKKKKLKMEAMTTDSKGKKSIRQLKREKHAQRQTETEVLAKDTLKQQNIQYLLQWKQDKLNWKFMKARQIWLFKNKFSVNLIPENIWPTLLNYFECAQGNVKKILLNDANDIIKMMDTWTEIQNSEAKENPGKSTENNIKKPDDVSYKRARDIIQNIQE